MTNKNCKIEFSRRATEGLTVSGHGQREAALLVDAVYWKDQVVNDVRSEQGRLSAREHQVSVNLISEVAALIAGYIARGEVLGGPADTIRRALNRNELPISARQASRVAKFLEVRGHGVSLRACMMARGETLSSHIKDARQGVQNRDNRCMAER